MVAMHSDDPNGAYSVHSVLRDGLPLREDDGAVVRVLQEVHAAADVHVEHEHVLGEVGEEPEREVPPTRPCNTTAVEQTTKTTLKTALGQ